MLKNRLRFKKFNKLPNTRQATIVFLSLFFLISVFFLWGEWRHFDLNETINHEKFNSYFASVGALATAFSVYLIYQQTKLIGEGNNLAFAPNLVVPPHYEFEFNLINQMNRDGMISVYRLERGPGDPDMKNALSLTLTNYGKSAALDVKLQLYNIALERLKPRPSAKEYVGLHERLTAIQEGESRKIDWRDMIEKMAESENLPETFEEGGGKFMYQSYKLTLSYYDGNNLQRKKTYSVDGIFHNYNGNRYKLSLDLVPTNSIDA